jgi:hypothetical protein
LLAAAEESVHAIKARVDARKRKGVDTLPRACATA